MFVPIRVVAEVPTVIAPEDDDGIFGETEAVEFGEHFTDLGVGVTYAGLVTADQIKGGGVVDGAFLRDALVGA